MKANALACRRRRSGWRTRLTGSVVGVVTILAVPALARAERSRVIVRLDVPARPESALAAPSSVAAQRASIAAAASMVVEDLAGTESEVVRAYETLPYLAIEVD